MSSATAGGQAGLLLVAARGRSGQIGRDNALLWRIPEDLKFFRSITMGRVLIMGRKTFDSIGGVALPGRQLVILSRSRGCDQAPVYWRDSPEAALELARRLSSHKPAVAGGAEIYRLLLPQADEMWLTEVDADPPADAHFPSFDEASWQEVERMRLAPNAIVRHLKRL